MDFKVDFSSVSPSHPGRSCLNYPHKNMEGCAEGSSGMPVCRSRRLVPPRERVARLAPLCSKVNLQRQRNGPPHLSEMSGQSVT